MIAIAAFFIAVGAILALVSQSLQNARYLQRPMVDAGMLASELSLTNKLVEGSDSTTSFGESTPSSSRGAGSLRVPASRTSPSTIA